ncbi:MAG: DDE-type integrase/transposase/recombinase [Clostridia bacterium]|nr:DDE-type integrase/transposase/recombinase [Clostridia bacterium]
MIDLFSRKVIAYRLSSQNNTNLTINTFKDAFENRNRPAELSFHTDQGTNYTSTAFRDLLQILKVNQSFSHRGNPYDNACMESFYASFKREEYNAKEYEFFEDLENSVDSYMEFYNNYRPHESLKNKTPNQFEAEFYKNLTIKKSQIAL